jgi:hypothetical protein
MHGDHATRVALVPGAAGSAAFWTPITERLPDDWIVTAIDLPGLGSVPARGDIRGYDDLAEYVAGIVAAPSAIVAPNERVQTARVVHKIERPLWGIAEEVGGDELDLGSPLVGERSGHVDRFGKDVDPSYFETFLGQPQREHARTAREVERARSSGASGHRRDEYATRTFAMPRQPLRIAFGLAIELCITLFAMLISRPSFDRQTAPATSLPSARAS